MTKERSAGGSNHIPEPIAQQAIEWMLELQAHPNSAAVRTGWSRWCDSDPLHASAWHRVEKFNDGMSKLGVAPTAAREALTAPCAHSRRHAVKLLAMLVFGGSLLWSVEEKSQWRRWIADISSEVGQQRRITLQDGTQLALNTNTYVNVRFTARERRLQLLQGEIHVATAHESGRPFLVQTDAGVAQAIGTRFTVLTQGKQARVNVYEGAVRVTTADKLDLSVLLKAGDGVHFESSAIGVTEIVDHNGTGWLDGMLVARSMRLDQFLAELSRYSIHPLSCASSVAGLRVSGSYPVADVPRILDALSATLNLQVETVTRFWGRQVVSMRLSSKDT